MLKIKNNKIEMNCYASGIITFENNKNNNKCYLTSSLKIIPCELETNKEELEALSKMMFEQTYFKVTLEKIEEEKKIPEKIEIYEDGEGHYFIDKHCKKIYITCDEVNFMIEEFNQLIDYLKSKGK